MTQQRVEGGCQCSAIRYSISGEPVMVAICHCTMCRRAHAAPAVAWAMYPGDQVDFSKAQPKVFASSPDARRGFCENCGTQISFTADFLPGLIDIAVGSFDHPDLVRPTLHYWHSKHLSWTEFADDLPRFPELPPIS